MQTPHPITPTRPSRLILTIIGLTALLTGLGSAQASVLQLNLGNAFNYDGYISTAENNEALSYNPPGDWGGLTDRMVRTVFGQHAFTQWGSGGRVLAWQSQVGAGHTGLPDDGKISFGDWDFQLSTTLDAAPPGGWGNPEYPVPTNPNGLLPTVNNVIYVARPHTGTADPPEAQYSFSLAAGEQQGYQSINFLMFGNSAAAAPNSRMMRIYADYEDGQELLWTGNVPSPIQSLDPATFPSHADLELAFTTTQNWSNAGSPSYQTMGTNAGNIFQFKDGLDLDENRILEGLTLHYVPQSWAAANFTILAATAVIPEPSAMALIALIGVGVLGFRLRRRAR